LAEPLRRRRRLRVLAVPQRRSLLGLRVCRHRRRRHAAGAEPSGADRRATSIAAKWADQRDGERDCRNAAQRGLDYIDTACPTDGPQTPTARLNAMEDRLWAARQTLLVTRAPLAKLYGALSDEQKARLNGPVSGSATGQAGRGTQSGAGCAQVSVNLPAARIEQRVRPSNEQRPALQALQMTASGLARLLAAACPSGTPPTPTERLDTADRRLNTLLYAVVTLRAPFDGFYASLSDQQKSRFNASR
jgi:hypothetical protein